MAVRLSVNLSDAVADALKKMAEENGITVTEQLRRSISTEKWLEETQREGQKVLVEDSKGNVREVRFQR